jgi:glycogen synthase
MKVLMTTDAVGGVWTYALELTAELSRRGVGIVLATMGPRPSTAQIEEARAIPCMRLAYRNYRLEWMEEPWSDVAQAGEWLLDLANREHVDLVHLNGYVHAALPWNRTVVSVAHSCVSSWWRAVHGCAPPARWDSYRRRVAAGLNSADAIVAPTQAFAREVCRWYGEQLKVAVIGNARSRHVSDARPRLPIVFACGRLWDEAKNFAVLDAAAARIPWNVHVAGSMISPDGSHAQPKSLRCLGVLSLHHVAAWMQRAAVFAHPARYEPFGLAVLEAAQSGCALVLADLPSLRELWDGAAIFVAPDDEDAMTHALRSLIDDPQLRRASAEAAQRRAQRFRPEVMGAAYLDLYRVLLARRTQGRAVA